MIVPTPFLGSTSTSPATDSIAAGNTTGTSTQTDLSPSLPADPSAPAPAPVASFDGLDYATWGAGHPPDTNGDVGPTYYIQTVNTSIGIYRKSDGFRVAAFTFDTLMSQGQFGNLCDTDNFGDPVVVYDTFEDRWIITDFAFKLDSSSNVVNPPGSFQCFAVSKSGDPVSGGWNFYSINTAGGLGDYPKFGIWPDGIYMSANMFDYAAAGSFQNVRLYALNKSQMYAGASTIQVVSFDAPSSEFTMLPANARLQTGTPPAGSPNYYAVVWNFLNAVSVYEFHVDWNSISLSSLTGPFISSTPTWWAQYSSSTGTAPTPANALDTLYPRLMMQNQYTNLSGVESLWDSHTVGAGNPTSSVSSAQAAVRYYQVGVTRGNVAPNTTQNFTYSPDTTIFRYMPSAAVNHTGDMAIGYTTSNSTTNPAIKYAGRLSTDAVNTISQIEQTLIQGTGSQSGNCGSTCVRWGDYSAMSLDPDGCTFWYTNEYYSVNGLNDLTRIGAFRFSTCTQTQIQTGTVQGTVTVGNSPINGATVALGSGRSTTTDTNGNYSFPGTPAGTYPSMVASYPGLNSSSAGNIVVASGGTTVQNFALTAAPVSGCITDTTQADFQAGVPTNCDLTGNPGNVSLATPSTIDQKNTTVTNNGFGFTNTSWAGQTFTPAVTGKLTRVDLDLFCSGCTGTTSNITVSVRATNGSVPTGADLAVATIPAFSSGNGGYFSANFSTPASLTAGVRYAIVFRAASSISPGSYAYVCSCTSNSNPYPNGQRITSSNSGTSWSTDNTAGGRDLGFVTYILAGFPSSGNLVSSAKDANPASGATPNWTTISWTASVPTSTTLQFQAAASNNVAGPFTFVGPDGTSATFFSNGGSLAQFNGKRYLKYKAILNTSDSTKTPTLSDVTVCFSDTSSTTSLAVAAASGTYGGTANLSATLTSGGNGLSGKSIGFTLDGNTAGTATTNGSGVATVSNVSLAAFTAGSYTGAVGASFAGDGTYTPSSGSNNLTVNKANQTITFGTLPDKTVGDPDFTVSATASSGLPVSFGASGQCTVNGNLVHLTAAGSCTITASQSGDSNYNAAPNVSQSFNINSAGPTTVSVTPNSGSGSSQTFSFVYSDSGGYAQITVAQAIINYYVTTVAGCALYYTAANNSLSLYNDAGTTLLPAIVVGQAGTLQNSQCSVNVGAASVTSSGTNLTLNVPLTFTSSFAGQKKTYMEVEDLSGLTSGWQQLGSWATIGSSPPANVSVTPNSGSGSSQTFSFVYSDGAGYNQISVAQAIINNYVTTIAGCALYYTASNNSLSLYQDDGNTLLPAIVVGQAGTLQNSQCSVNVAAASVNGSGTTLTLTVPITFTPSFAGQKQIYMELEDSLGRTSGWQQLGSWATIGSSPPANVSVTPNSGSGSSQTFSFVYSDGGGYAQITVAQAIINNYVTTIAGCALYYTASNNSLSLYNDAGTTLLPAIVVGQAGTLQNSQCSVNVAAASVTGLGTNLTLTVPVTFTSFTGQKQTYMEVEDSLGLTSGWQMLGSWTVP